jgi:hypothetical protein
MTDSNGSVMAQDRLAVGDPRTPMEGFKRPQAVVLPDSSLVPPDCVISPAPNQFTHEVAVAQPFYFSRGEPGDRPSGDFVPGTRVALLLRYDGKMCRVVDGAGLYVSTAFQGLRRL